MIRKSTGYDDSLKTLGCKLGLRSGGYRRDEQPHAKWV